MMAGLQWINLILTALLKLNHPNEPINKNNLDFSIYTKKPILQLSHHKNEVTLLSIHLAGRNINVPAWSDFKKIFELVWSSQVDSVIYLSIQPSIHPIIMLL